MAELKDVLGAVLKDMAHSRVISDQFSSEVSQEYDKDPILGVFPVPRVEIREASINLKFAVNAVEKSVADIAGAARALSAGHSTEMVSAILRDVIEKHPQAAEIQKLLETKNLDLEERLRAAGAAAIVADPKALESARKGETDALAKRVAVDVSAALLEDADLKRLLVSRGVRVGAIRQAIQERANAAAKSFGTELEAEAAAAERQSLRIDVGVTRKELADTPELLVSQISLVAQIRNYEWVEVGEEDGKPVKRLRPE